MQAATSQKVVSQIAGSFVNSAEELGPTSKLAVQTVRSEGTYSVRKASTTTPPSPLPSRSNSSSGKKKKNVGNEGLRTNIVTARRHLCRLVKNAVDERFHDGI